MGNLLLNVFELLFKGSSNSIQIEIATLFIAIVLVTWTMYLIVGKSKNGDKSASSLMLIITGIVVIGIVSTLRVLYGNPYKEYYFDIIITILSGLVGGVFVILSLNYQARVSDSEIKRLARKQKEDEIKSIRPYLYLKYHSSGGSIETKYDDIDRQLKRSIKFSLMNVGNGRAFEIKYGDMYNVNIFNENEVLNVDESLLSKNLGFSFNLDELKEVNLRIDFKDVLDNKYYQEFTVELLVPKIGNERINIKKTLPKLIID